MNIFLAQLSLYVSPVVVNEILTIDPGVDIMSLSSIIRQPLCSDLTANAPLSYRFVSTAGGVHRDEK